MPWHVAKSAKCAPSKPWAVIKDADSSIVACHESEYSAKQQLKALYANEPGARSEAGNADYLRALPFEAVASGDGLSLEGYAVTFNTPAHVRDWAGEYDETIAPGAFDRSLRDRMPDLLFEHGQHPLIGNIPLGVIQDISPDSRGYHIRARMSDNWLIQPVRDAIRDGGITGMSVHFNLRDIKGGEAWSKEGDSLRHHVTNANLIELGPVLRPAYKLTTASVRSVLDKLPDQEPLALVESEQPANYAMLQAARRARSRLAWLTRTPLEEHSSDG